MSTQNEQYIFKAKEILKLIISSGAEGYIVGESLCNIVLEYPLDEIEIFTGLPKENALLLFCDYNVTVVDDYTLIVLYLGYKFKISLARPYDVKVKVNVAKRHYSTSLMEFLAQKDYTINALAMGINNVIYDCYNGKEDLNKRRLRMISENPKTVFSLNPIKILKAITLVSKYGYKLDKNIYKAMKSKAKLLKNVPLEMIALEVKQIYEGNHFKKALKILIKSNVNKRLSLFKNQLKKIYKSFSRESFEVFLGACMVKQKKYFPELENVVENSQEFKMLVNLAITNLKGIYDNLTLYSHGLDICIKANQINYVLGKASKRKKQITKAYEALPIKKSCDLVYKGDEILKLTENKMNSDDISDLIDNIVYAILNGELHNDYSEIEKFVLRYLNQHNETSNVSDDLLNLEENKKEDLEELSSEEVTSQNVNVEEKEINQNDENNFNPEKVDKKDDLNVGDYETIQKRQEELLARIYNLEISNLQNELEKEIERKIKQSGLLDGLTGPLRTTTYETLKKVYYDVLINTEKYERLRKTDDERRSD